MSSPSVTTTIDSEEPIEALPYMALWVRGGLMCVAAFLILIFSIAIYLDPYIRDSSGQIIAARRFATHTTMGLPPCTFYEKTGLPCPSCGMTTSFALLIRGDLWHSVQANFAGTLLGSFCLFLIPWSLACIWKQRLLLVRSFETMFTICIAVLMAVMMLRWVIVAGLLYFFGKEIWM